MALEQRDIGNILRILNLSALLLVVRVKQS
jgi:hypothetical protein